ncbi:DUF6207 family protein [Streptomyces canus]|uniref:DUF6207 family protein n=1 Tax=Streptomyces canus TaxID=58343 RepID=UPI0033AFEA26
MGEITDAHVAEPGLAVVEVTAADDETAFTIQELLAAQRAIAPADRTTREPGWQQGGRDHAPLAAVVGAMVRAGGIPDAAASTHACKDQAVRRGRRSHSST